MKAIVRLKEPWTVWSSTSAFSGGFFVIPAGLVSAETLTAAVGKAAYDWAVAQRIVEVAYQPL